MAKIYETKEDFERDKLKEQALRLRGDANSQSGFGAALAGIAIWLENVNIGKEASRGVRSTGLSIASTVAGVVGVVEMVRSWFTHNKAHNLTLERERMGTAKEVHLFDSPQNVDLAMNPAEPCCNKPQYRQNIQPTSLIEQATKTDTALHQK